jgi:MOSC domain-containing protein YiiM
LPQYGDQPLGITGQRLRGFTSRVIASGETKRGDQCRGEIRHQGVDG